MKNNHFSFKLPFSNNIAILESKIIYFCLRSNFRERTTLINVVATVDTRLVTLVKVRTEGSTDQNIEIPNGASLSDCVDVYYHCSPTSIEKKICDKLEVNIRLGTTFLYFSGSELTSRIFIQL